MLIASWQSTVESIATAVAALGVGVAAVGVFLAREQIKSAKEQIEQAERSRHAQTAADFSRRWDETDLLETRQMIRAHETGEQLRDEYRRSLADTKTDRVLRLLREPDYFEDLAILEGLGAIDYEFIRRSLGDLVVRRWAIWEPTIDAIRDENEGRDNYPAFRELAARLARDDTRA